MDINQAYPGAGLQDKEPGELSSAGSQSAVEGVPVLVEPRTVVVWEMERDLRRAKAAQLEWMLRFHQEYVAEALAADRQDYQAAVAAGGSSLAPAQALGQRLEYAVQEAGRAAIMYIAEAVGRSEYVVTCEYHAASRARARLPRVWEAFTQGRICDLRLRRISSAVRQLRSEEDIADLDDRAPGYAQTHRIGQLESWLKRFVHTAEPVEASQRFAQAARGRRVTVTDVDDGMSVLTAVIPTLTARAIQRRLEVITRSPVHPVPHNPLIAEHSFELQQQESFARLVPEDAGEPELSGVNQAGAGHLVPEALDSGLLAAMFPAASSDVPAGSCGEMPAQLGVDLPAGLPEGLPRELTGPWVVCGASIGNTHSGACSTVSSGPGPTLTLHITDGPHRAEEGSCPGETETGCSPGFSMDELPTTREAGDPRSLDQRAADVFCAWMLNTQTPEGIEVDAQIGVIVTEETLTGGSERPATTRDGTAVIPAGAVRVWLEQQIGGLEWYQLLHSKDADLLAIKSAGRYPPPRLRTALWFRDRSCTVQGCTVPAKRCDADHINPYHHGGETTAENLQLLCRKHHRLKSWNHPTHPDYHHVEITVAA